MVAPSLSLNMIVAEMRQKAREHVHDYEKEFLVCEELLRKWNYKGYGIEAVLSLDILDGKNFWHLSLQDNNLPPEVLSEIVLTFLDGKSPIIEIPRVILPGAEHLRQFAQEKSD